MKQNHMALAPDYQSPHLEPAKKKEKLPCLPFPKYLRLYIYMTLIYLLIVKLAAAELLLSPCWTWIQFKILTACCMQSANIYQFNNNYTATICDSINYECHLKLT